MSELSCLPYSTLLEKFSKADKRVITAHEIDRNNLRIGFHVQWTMDPVTRFLDKWENGFLDEWDIQNVDQDLLLEYWQRKGGRDHATGLDLYHVYCILGEHRTRGYKVQWTGYSRKECTWESRAYVTSICPGAVLEWNNGK